MSQLRKAILLQVTTKAKAIIVSAWSDHKFEVILGGIAILGFAAVVVAITLACGRGIEASSSDHELGSANRFFVESGILVSMDSEIPTKRIVEFRNIVLVSHNSPSIEDLPIDEFLSEVKNRGANGVINFTIGVYTSPTLLRAMLIYGTAVVVE